MTSMPRFFQKLQTSLRNYRIPTQRKELGIPKNHKDIYATFKDSHEPFLKSLYQLQRGTKKWRISIREYLEAWLRTTKVLEPLFFQELINRNILVQDNREEGDLNDEPKDEYDWLKNAIMRVHKPFATLNWPIFHWDASFDKQTKDGGVGFLYRNPDGSLIYYAYCPIIGARNALQCEIYAFRMGLLYALERNFPFLTILGDNGDIAASLSGSFKHLEVSYYGEYCELFHHLKRFCDYRVIHTYREVNAPADHLAFLGKKKSHVTKEEMDYFYKLLSEDVEGLFSYRFPKTKLNNSIFCSVGPSGEVPSTPQPPQNQSSLENIYGEAASDLAAGSNLEAAVQQCFDVGGWCWETDTALSALLAAKNKSDGAIHADQMIDFMYKVPNMPSWKQGSILTHSFFENPGPSSLVQSYHASQCIKVSSGSEVCQLVEAQVKKTTEAVEQYLPQFKHM